MKPTPTIMQRPIDALIPYDRNARTHSPAQVAQIAASIREFGWTNPILVDDADGVIAGHGRLLAARSLGMVTVPCLALSGLTDAQRRAYVLADNQLATNAGWDTALLQLELKDLDALGFDLQLLGFSDADLAGPTPPEKVGLTDPDAVPPLQGDAITRAGDVWTLGPHRVMCGDCRERVDVDRLMAGAVVNLAFTSPPYASQREYDTASAFRPIPPDAFVAWYADVAANVMAHLADDGSYFCNIKPSADGLDTHLYVFDLVIAHVRAWGWHFATEFCWQRNGVPKGVTQRFKNQFEPVYQFAKGRWKMRPEAVRHASENVPISLGRRIGRYVVARPPRDGRRDPVESPAPEERLDGKQLVDAGNEHVARRDDRGRHGFSRQPTPDVHRIARRDRPHRRVSGRPAGILRQGVHRRRGCGLRPVHGQRVDADRRREAGASRVRNGDLAALRRPDRAALAGVHRSARDARGRQAAVS